METENREEKVENGKKEIDPAKHSEALGKLLIDNMSAYSQYMVEELDAEKHIPIAVSVLTTKNLMLGHMKTVIKQKALHLPTMALMLADMIEDLQNMQMEIETIDK